MACKREKACEDALGSLAAGGQELLEAGDPADRLERGTVVLARLLREAEESEEHERREDRDPALELGADHSDWVEVPYHGCVQAHGPEVGVGIRPRDPWMHRVIGDVHDEHPCRERDGDCDVGSGNANEPRVTVDSQVLVVSSDGVEHRLTLEERSDRKNYSERFSRG